MKHFLKVLFAALLCLAPTLGSDATQRVAALVSPQTINVDLGFVQLGNVGNLSVMGAPSGATFSLLNNPGGHFSISGPEIVADPSTPAGQYSLSVQATGSGYSVNKTFVLNFSGVTPPTPHFFLGINISGAQNQFATFASNAELDYWKNRNVTEIRFPIGWSTANASYATGFSGIQPAAFGALDTTSTNYNGQSYVAALTAVINHAAANGQHIYLDMHSFGCVFNTCPGNSPIGAGLPISAFVDVWTKIVTQFMGNPGFGGIDLMNEWVIGDSSIIQDAQQQAITGVRALGWTGKIYVEGANFTGAWNWVSGQNGIGGSNSANLYQIVDPANNIVFETHSYLDNDSSGSNFAWALEVAKPGAAPPGTPTSATIGLTRLNREVIPWSQSHGVRLNMGETGNSADYLALGGADNWQAWTTATKNELDLCVANNIEVFMWGPGFSADYGFNPEPSNILNPALVDYSSAGLQAMQMTLMDQYTGYSGAQPTAYRVDLPVTITATANPEAPSISKNPYATVGSPSGNFTIRYGGKITSPVTITPHATLMDGTAGGGTFTPATIVLAAGNNAIANFTYTPSQAATFKISTTNNAGWIPPPALGFSSINDSYVSLLPNLPSNEYGMFNRYTPNIGPAVRLQRSTDNQQMDWYFTLAGEGGYLGFDRAAIQNWASARAGITVIRHYDESPSGNHIIFNRGGNFLGAIVGTTLTVSDGSGIAAGQTLLDNSFAVPANVHVVSGSGTTWTLDTSLNISSEQMFTASTSGVALATLNLSNANDYPEITDPSTSSSILRGVFNVPFAGQTQMSVIARMDQTGSPTAGLFRTDHFTGPLNWSNANIQFARTGWVGPTNLTSAAVIATTNLNVTNGTYGDYGYVYNANSSTGHRTYKDGSVTTSQTSVLTSFTGTGSGTNLTTTSVTGSILPTDGVFGSGVPAGTYVVSQTSGTAGGAGVYVTSQATTSSADALQTSSIMNPAFSDGTTNLGWFQFASTFWSGAYTNLEFLPFLINDTQVGSIMSADATYYSIPLPTLPAFSPSVIGTGPSTAPVGFTSGPFAATTVLDPNSGSPTDSVTITLAGSAGGTLTGTGLSGSGPYTMSAASAATITSQLRSIVYTPAGGVSTTETMTVMVTSSAGTSTSDSNTVVTVVNVVAPTISGTTPTVTIVGKSSNPFIHNASNTGSLLPYTTALAVVTDPNGPTITDTATITLTGSAGGTLSGTGLSGTGPYTLGPASAATITTQLQGLLYNPGGATATQTETLSVLITSQTGTTASNAGTVVTVNAVAPAETSFAAPGGTFTPVGNFSGVNLAGAENAWPQNAANGRFKYIYPLATDIQYWSGATAGSTANFGIIRVPLSARRLQPDSYGPLDPVAFIRNSTNCPYQTASQDGFVGRCDEPAQSSVATAGTQTNLVALKASIDAAYAAGVYVMLDMHEFGALYNTLQNYQQIFPGEATADGAEGTAQLVDEWQRIVTKFKNYPNVMFDIMNEPFAQTAAEWFTAQTAVNNAIAVITTSHIVFIEGTAFTGGHSWVGSGNAAAWAGYVPPVGLQVVYEMHEYLDSDFSGSHPACTNGSAPMAGATAWGVANNVKILIGEMGWSQDSSCPPLATQLLNYFVANDQSNSGPYWGYTYWVGGSSPFYGPWSTAGSYMYSATPAGLPSGPFSNSPQEGILHSNILNFLLKRDIDPSSNDNDPAWLEKVA